MKTDAPFFQYQSVPLPRLDGRNIVTDEMLAEHPHLQEWIARTKEHWERDSTRFLRSLK